MKKIIDIYETNKHKGTDISEHLETLYELGKQCDHITEFGVREGISTSAFLASNPKCLESYDIIITPQAHALLIMSLTNKINFKLYQSNTLLTTIRETDMLFIDTLHTYEQVKRELSMNGNKAKKYLVFHDTELFRNVDEQKTSNPKKGIQLAIDEFVKENPHWILKKHYTNNNGLSVYERITQKEQ
jgi:hypothetical protein